MAITVSQNNIINVHLISLMYTQGQGSNYCVSGDEREREREIDTSDGSLTTCECDGVCFTDVEEK